MAKKIDKKGSVVDLLTIGIILMFFALFVLIGLKVAGEFQKQLPSIQGVDVNTSSYVNQTVGNYTGTIDKSFLFFAMLLAAVTLILASLVRIHPIFILFYFIGLILIIFLCGIFSNIYTEMASDVNLVDTANTIPLITTIMQLLPFFVGVFGIILCVISYKMWQNG